MRPTPEALEVQRRVWIAGTLASAALWAGRPGKLPAVAARCQQIALILVVTRSASPLILILAPQFALYLAFNGLVHLPAIARVALPGGRRRPADTS